MRKELSYNQVRELLQTSQSDELLHQGLTLLEFVHDLIKVRSFKKEDFVFTQFEEGHILVTEVRAQ